MLLVFVSALRGWRTDAGEEPMADLLHEADHTGIARVVISKPSGPEPPRRTSMPLGISARPLKTLMRSWPREIGSAWSVGASGSPHEQKGGMPRGERAKIPTAVVRGASCTA